MSQQDQLRAAHRAHRTARAIHWATCLGSLGYLSLVIHPSMNRDAAFAAIWVTFMVSNFATQEYHSRRVAAIKQGGNQ